MHRWVFRSPRTPSATRSMTKVRALPPLAGSFLGSSWIVASQEETSTLSRSPSHWNLTLPDLDLDLQPLGL